MQGIKHKMPFAEYLDHPAISKSALDQINRSPAHYKWSLTHERPDTESMLLGRALHASVLESEEYGRCYVVAPKIDKRTKAGKEAWAAFMQESGGCEVITKETGDTVKAMTDSIYSHPAAKAVLDHPGKAETSIFWEDNFSGVQCKCRPDWWRDDNIIVDLKTTQDARAIPFSKTVYNYRYHVQAAFYMAGCEAANKERAKGFIIIAVEKTPPYLVGVYALDQLSISAGATDYMQDLETYIQCRDADWWPGYSEQVEELTLPAWALK